MATWRWTADPASALMLFEIFRDVCLPIVALIGLGWLMDRRFALDLDTLVKLNLYLFVPAFIFRRVSESEIEGVLALRVVLFTLCVIGSMAWLSWLAARALKISTAQRTSLQLSTMFYNSGNWGIPLMTLAFPSGMGAVVQVFVLMTMNISTFSLGLLLASSQGAEEARGKAGAGLGWRRFLPMLRQPSIYAIGLALALRPIGNPLQDLVFVWKPIGYLADALVGFALITLGVQLSKAKPPRIEGHLASALVIRLIGGPLVAAGLIWVFGFRGELAAILIAGAAAPTAVNTALLAHEFKADSRFAAAVVFYTTLIAVGVVTALLGSLRAGWIPGAG